MDDLQRSTPLVDPQIITRSTDKLIVSEAEYFQKYYDYPDIVYEWNNGVLEEKPVADHSDYLTYDWFVDLLREYLKVHPVAKTT